MSDFVTRMGSVPDGAQDANNYACQGWQLIMDEYRSLEHPSKEQQEALAARARECLTVLDGAGMLASEEWAQALLIYENCKQVVRSVKDSYYYEQDEEDPEKWHRRSLPLSVKFELPGQAESWDGKARRFRDMIEAAYLSCHTDEVEERSRLDAEVSRLEAQLDELKAEKRSKGFFNFSEKREVKERMRPVKDELASVRSEISSLERRLSDYVEGQLDALAASHIRLKF